MKSEAEANAESDKAAKEKVDKLNEADQMVFQTEKLLKESGDKLSADNKTKIEGALEELKTAYATQEVEKVQPALDNLNEIWKSASEEIYKAQAEGAQGGAQPGPDAGQASGGEAEGASGSDVEDVDFEEVK